MTCEVSEQFTDRPSSIETCPLHSMSNFIAHPLATTQDKY
jgi:hypothetical protein